MILLYFDIIFTLIVVFCALVIVPTGTRMTEFSDSFGVLYGLSKSHITSLNLLLNELRRARWRSLVLAQRASSACAALIHIHKTG